MANSCDGCSTRCYTEVDDAGRLDDFCLQPDTVLLEVKGYRPYRGSMCIDPERAKSSDRTNREDCKPLGWDYLDTGASGPSTGYRHYTANGVEIERCHIIGEWTGIRPILSGAKDALNECWGKQGVISDYLKSLYPPHGKPTDSSDVTFMAFIKLMNYVTGTRDFNHGDGVCNGMQEVESLIYKKLSIKNYKSVDYRVTLNYADSNGCRALIPYSAYMDAYLVADEHKNELPTLDVNSIPQGKPGRRPDANPMVQGEHGCRIDRAKDAGLHYEVFNKLGDSFAPGQDGSSPSDGRMNDLTPFRFERCYLFLTPRGSFTEDGSHPRLDKSKAVQFSFNPKYGKNQDAVHGQGSSCSENKSFVGVFAWDQDFELS